MQITGTTLKISLCKQRLDLLNGGEILASYPISSSLFGTGTEEGSMKTPLGRFTICEKIGHGLPLGTAFRGRIPLRAEEVPPGDDDQILSRILWLDGIEEHNANTRQRFIYIHGTNHEETIGQPTSHGCIRMRNADLIALFDRVPVGTEVLIEA